MDLNEIWTKYQMLIVAIFTLVIAPLFWKLAGGLWSVFVKLCDKLGQLAGGRLAYRSFQKKYLNWIVTENKELKLTGIVSYDEAKKPQLEQVFISLRLGKEEGRVAEAKSILYQAQKTWWRRTLLSLLFGVKKRIKSAEPQDWLTNVAEKIDTARKRKLRGWLVRRTLGISSHKATSEGLAQLRRVLRSHQYFAILGGPGAGKTTLLQFIALVFARQRAGDPKLRRVRILEEQFDTHHWRLPIFVTLRTVATMLVKNVPEAVDVSLVDALVETLPPDLQKECPPRYFRDRFEQGNCIVLLDGLDEVLSDEEFEAVLRAVKSVKAMYPENQYVVTSRPTGWRGGVGSEFEVLEVNELTDEEISQFIDSWYTAVEKNAVAGPLENEGESERLARERRAATRAAELEEALSRNVGISRLAQNPLLLSIIALVHRSLATLPRERAKLYSECSKILLEQWDVSRGVRVDDTNLKLAQKEAIMRRIAYALHTGEIGEKVGGREATRDQVEKLVGEMLSSMGQPPQNAHRLLQRLIERSGLIAEQRRGVLIFAHLTFQEYFTAQALANGRRSEVQETLLRGESLFSDWWHEVILLYAGLIPDASEFIEHIYRPRLDTFFRPRLRLAAMCLGEAVEIKKTDIRQSIGRELLKIHTIGEITSDHTSLPIELIEYLIEWSRSNVWYEYAATMHITESHGRNGDIERGVAELTSALDEKDSYIRMAAIGVLGLVGERACTASVIDKLVAMLSSDILSLQLFAVNTLDKISHGAYVEETINSLIPLLQSEQAVISSASAKALINLTKKIPLSSKAMDTLWSVFDRPLENLEPRVPDIAISSRLRPLDLASSFGFRAGRYTTWKRVQHRYSLDYDSLIELEYQAYALSSLARRRYGLDYDSFGELEYRVYARHVFAQRRFFIEESVATESGLVRDLIRELTPVLGDLAKLSLPNPAGLVLANVARESEQHDIIHRFESMLDSDDEETRIIGAQLLGAVGGRAATQQIISRLAASLRDENPLLRKTAAQAISAFGEKARSVDVVENLFLALNDRTPYVRAAAMMALASLADEASISRITAKLTPLIRERDPGVRRAAIDALAILGRETTISQITDFLNSALRDRKKTVRTSAAHAIAELGEKAGTQVITNLLINLQDKDANVRVVTAMTLKTLGEKAATPEVVERLLVSVDDPSWEVRQAAIDALAVLAKKERALLAVDKLLFALRDADGDVRETAVEALEALGGTTESSYIVGNLSKLLDDVDASVRRSAMKALSKLESKAITPTLRDKLIRALRDRSTRSAALQAIQRFESRLITDQTISAVLPLLQDREIKGVAYRALEALHVESGRWTRKVGGISRAIS